MIFRKKTLKVQPIWFFHAPLIELGDKIIDKKISLVRLGKVIEEIIFKSFDIIIDVSVAKVIDQEDPIIVHAFFDHTADPLRHEAEIEIVFSGPNTKAVMITDELWTRVSLDIAKSIQHELVHKKQHEDRDFEPNEFEPEEHEDEYLSDPDEIEAHAYDAFSELYANFKTRKKIRKKLRNIRKTTINDSLTIYSFLKSFDYDFNHPTVKSFVKKIWDVFKEHKKLLESTMLNESLDKPYKIKNRGKNKKEFTTENGVTYIVLFEMSPIGRSVRFVIKDKSPSEEIKIKNINPFRVFATVMLIIEKWIIRVKPRKLTFVASTNEITKLYNIMLTNKKIQDRITKHGYNFFRSKYTKGWVIKQKLGLW